MVTAKKVAAKRPAVKDDVPFNPTKAAATARANRGENAPVKDSKSWRGETPEREAPAPKFEQKSKLKLPKTLAECADLLYQKREARLAAQRGVDALKVEEEDLVAWVIDQLPKSQATGISGKVANIKVLTSVLPQVKDWDKVYAYVKRTGSFDLMNRAINKKAVEARWEAGKDVPGVERYNALKVSCTKVS